VIEQFLKGNDSMGLQQLKVPKLTPRFDKALAYAARLHRVQTRKGTEIPYVAHLLGVAALVLEDGGDEDETIAALLHDAVEDQGGRPILEEIRRRFGERIAHIVEGCTDAETIPKPPWRKRKQQYIKHVKRASADVRRVSAADKLHNARTILSDYRNLGDKLWLRFNGGREGTLWYYRALINAFRKAGPSAIVEELDRVVSELEHLVSTQSPSNCS
jgi:GTP pyrophosphokinase